LRHVIIAVKSIVVTFRTGVSPHAETQKRVELLLRDWKKNREYLPPPTIGELADLDSALLVSPSKGLEIGYVPIATRQAAKE
jgi:hypothetical protein